MNAVQLLSRQPWVEQLGWTLLHFLWQGAAIAILFGVARGLAGRRLTAQSRYWMACLALAAMVTAPLITLCLTGTTPFRGELLPAAAGEAWARTSTGAGTPAIARWSQALPWMVLAWLAGAVVFSVRLAGGWMLATRLRTIAVRPAPREWQRTLDGLSMRIGMSRPVRLLVSSLVQVPTVVGWVKPVVLIPIGALAGLPAEQVEALLAHELAHILRRDYLANLLQSVAEALLFYHPAVWWVSQQIRLERELCCDDVAVAVSGDVLTYARALAELESCRPVRIQTAMAANGGSLRNRISRLLGQSQPAAHIGPRPGAALAASLVLVAAIGALAVRGDQAIEPLPDHHGVSVDTSGARLIHRVPVAYPAVAIEKRVEGTVVAQVMLDAQGDATDARIVSGPEELRKPVLQSVLQWHFAPGGSDRSRQVRVNFQLAAAQAMLEEKMSAFGETHRQVEMDHAMAAAQEDARRHNTAEFLDRFEHSSRVASEMNHQRLAEMQMELAEEKRNMEQSQQLMEEVQIEVGRRSADFQSDLVRLQMEAERKRAAADSRNGDISEEQQQRLAQLAAAQVELSRLAHQYTEQHPDMLEREREVARLKSNLDGLADGRRSNFAVGRFLDVIEVRGMDESAARELLSRIPVHKGDTLSPESIEATRRALNQFDGHLVMVIGPLENNGAVLRISPAGAPHTLLHDRQ